jgi:transposase
VSWRTEEHDQRLPLPRADLVAGRAGAVAAVTAGAAASVAAGAEAVGLCGFLCESGTRECEQNAERGTMKLERMDYPVAS